MLELFLIGLEAHSSELNHHRRYELSVCRDLLEHWSVTIRYGRAGSPLRELRFGLPDADAARSVVRERLRRRLSAPRRIGCSYRLTELADHDEPGCLPWVPPSLLRDLIALE